MRSFIGPDLALLIVLLLSLSCKQTEERAVEPLTPEQLADSVAYAHGFADWSAVRELQFTFNVDRDTTHFERKWSWDTQSNEVQMIVGQDTVTFNRKQVDSTTMQADAAFVNDKFWLLAPYQLVWDRENLSLAHDPEAIAPISGDTLQKLTMVYGTQGGYTPGDAYDLFIGEDYLLKEWNFRKANQDTPNMSTTWEDYVELGNLRIAKMHQGPEGKVKLYFTGLGAAME